MTKKDFIIVFVALAISSFLVWYGSTKQLFLLKPEVKEETPAKEIVETESNLIFGKPEAQLLVEVYSNYGCGFCARYYNQSLKPFIKDYVDTGKAKLVYHHFEWGETVSLITQAAYCAHEQNKFLVYNGKLFAMLETDERSKVFEKDYLIELAKETNLNLQEFQNCLEAQKYTAIIKNIRTVADARGVNAVPTTFINGKMIADETGRSLGAMPYEILKEKLAEALK